MAALKNVVYLSNSDYSTLVTTGTVTINGTTLTYDNNDLYITPDQNYQFINGASQFTVTFPDGSTQTVNVGATRNVTKSNAAVTSGRLVAWSAAAEAGADGVVKDAGASITTTAPSASSNADTTIPTSKAVWSAITGASGYGKTGTVTKVTAGTGLNTSADQSDSATKGDITTTGTLYLTTSGVTANTYGNTSQQTPSHGGTFNIPYFTVDKYGRITSASTTTVKLPADNNTDTKVKVTTGTTTKSYLIGVTATGYSTGAAIEAITDTGVYLDITASRLTAGSLAWHVNSTAKAYTQYNSTDDSIEFNFI